MHIRENKTRNGISYQLYYSGKDPKTRANKLYQKTFQVPSDIVGKKKATEKFLLDCQREFQEEVEKLSQGLTVKKEKIKFIDFVKEHVESIIKDHPDRYNHYVAMKGHLPVVEEKLGYYYVHEINKYIMQEFCRWLNERTYEKVTVIVIDSLRPMMKQRKITITQTTKDTGVADITLNGATRIGNTTSENTAVKLCKYFNVPINKYFDIKKESVRYSRSAKVGVRALLSVALTKAARRGLIERNFMAREFVDSVTGEDGEKEIYEGKEITEFMKCVATEKDIRKKVAFSIFINLGLRIGEVAGLEFGDINFFTNEITINRTSVYTSAFGIKTKKPKTKASRAILSVPQGLMDLLAEYKIWWDNQKIMHGDLWEHTNRLFCQSNGKDMSGGTIRGWLNDFQKRNGLKHVSPHGLRHTNITMQIDNGIDPKTVSERARHANVGITLNVYTHRTSRGDRTAADIIDKVLAV